MLRSGGVSAFAIVMFLLMVFLIQVIDAGQ